MSLAFLFLKDCSQEGGTDNATSPNIILIMADDMGFECISAYGSLSYQTPNIDRMALQGMLVSNCIANPLCTPSRVKIMTGLHNFRNYEYFGYLNPEEYTFGHLMQDAGYATCIAGKWQLNGIYHNLPGSDDPTRPGLYGFDEYCLWQVHKGKHEGERYADPLIVENGKLLPRDTESYGPDIFADYVCDFIERKKDSSFFIYYPMVLVHDPFVATPDSEGWELEKNRFQNDTAYFKDMVAYADKIVGRILEKLEEAGIEDNTLVIFTSDNGTHRSIRSSMPGRTIPGGKGMTIDAGVHVPLVIHWPKMIPEGKKYEGVVDFTDFFATFADITKQKRVVDGTSLLPVLENVLNSHRDFALVHYDPMWGNWVNQYRNQFVQDEQYKVYRDGSLYDVTRDFNEQHPLDPSSTQELTDRHMKMLKLMDTIPLLPKSAD